MALERPAHASLGLCKVGIVPRRRTVRVVRGRGGRELMQMLPTIVDGSKSQNRGLVKDETPCRRETCEPGM